MSQAVMTTSENEMEDAGSSRTVQQVINNYQINYTLHNNVDNRSTNLNECTVETVGENITINRHETEHRNSAQVPSGQTSVQGFTESNLSSIMELMVGKIADDINVMGYKNKSDRNMPIVYPQLHVVEDYYEKDQTLLEGRSLQRKHHEINKETERVVIHDFIGKFSQTPSSVSNKFTSELRTSHNLSLALIGPAGSGKTTLTKRITKLAVKTGLKSWLLNFKDYSDEIPLSLEDLLINIFISDEARKDKASVERDFNWILSNQDQCLISVDGLDQATFKISDDVPKAVRNYKTPLPPSVLFSLLCTRKFLPGVRLVISSRPHSIARLAPKLRPNRIVFVNDLKEDDMKVLIRYYIGDDCDNLLETLGARVPRVVQLARIPLFLHLITILHKQLGQTVWDTTNTATRLFLSILKLFQTSHHYATNIKGKEMDMKTIEKKISEIALEKTLQGCVVIQCRDLKKRGLDPEDVQNLLFSAVENNGVQWFHLVEGILVFYFSHQLFQDFFSVKQLVEHQSFDDFKSFLDNKLFTNYHSRFSKDSRTKVDELSEIQAFTSGYITEPNTDNDCFQDFGKKKTYFLETLVNAIRDPEVFSTLHAGTTYEMAKHRRNLMCTVMEITDSSITEQIRSELKSVNFHFGISQRLNGNIGDRLAFFNFIEKVVTNLGFLELTLNASWSCTEMENLLTLIKSIPGKIQCIVIRRVEVLSPLVLTLIEDVLERMVTSSSNLSDFHLSTHDSDGFNLLKERLEKFDRIKLKSQKVDVDIKVVENGKILDKLFIRLQQPQQGVEEQLKRSRRSIRKPKRCHIS